MLQTSVFNSRFHMGFAHSLQGMGQRRFGIDKCYYIINS